MSIIKESFTEGRTTPVAWTKSEAYKKAKLMELTDSNVLIFTDSDEKYNKKKFQQIDMETGKVLRTFSSVTSASKWIMENNSKMKLTRTRTYQINGNLRMSMMQGFSSYGFYWKVLSHKSRVKVTETMKGFKFNKPKMSTKHSKNKKYYVLSPRKVKAYEAKSVAGVARATNVSTGTANRLMVDVGYGVEINGHTVVSATAFNKTYSGLPITAI